tara:strand:+ start:30 stop:353 length:324 start_codon:yes stop_codon:yes gene_type:complete
MGAGQRDVEQEQRLNDLFREHPVHRVFSRTLGEVIVWADDNAETETDEHLVIYRKSELQHLVGISQRKLKLIHAVKASFDGELLDLTDPSTITALDSIDQELTAKNE